MYFEDTREFGSVTDAVEIPELSQLQRTSYGKFLQADADPEKRKAHGIEGLLQEIFPIVSYDENMRLEYISYDLGKPRYSPDECRQLRLTYGVPFRIRCRMIRKDKNEIMEDSVYLEASTPEMADVVRVSDDYRRA